MSTEPASVISDMTAAMLIIKSLDPSASLELSEYTQQWYVSARIDISDGACLSGVTEHEDTPDVAVRAFLNRITEVGQHDHEHVLVTRFHGERRHHRWNGRAFVEEPVDWFRAVETSAVLPPRRPTNMSDERSRAIVSTIEVPVELLAWCYANLTTTALGSPRLPELLSALGEGLGDPRPPESPSTCNCKRLTYPHGRSYGSGCPKWGPWSERDAENGSSPTPEADR
jgi:hypothetical protein